MERGIFFVLRDKNSGRDQSRTSRPRASIAATTFEKNLFRAWKGFFLYIYGELSRAISRGRENNCVYPIGVGSNVVLTRRCRESYADQR